MRYFLLGAAGSLAAMALVVFGYLAYIGALVSRIL